MLIRSTHEPSPHSQIRSSGCDLRSNASARSSIRSLTSRNTASFSPIRVSRSLIPGYFSTTTYPSRRATTAYGLLSLLVTDRGHEVAGLSPYRGVLRACQAHDLAAPRLRALAQEWKALHLDLIVVRPLSDPLVRLTEPRIVLHDALCNRVVHLARLIARSALR